MSTVVVVLALLVVVIPLPSAKASCYHSTTRDYIWDYGQYQYGSYAVKSVANNCADMNLSYSSITELHRGQYWLDGYGWRNSSQGPIYVWAGSQGVPAHWPALIEDVAVGATVRIGAQRFGTGTWRY